MALGALSLPSVSTSFNSASTSMAPVSIQGMTGTVQKMSPLETMEVIFLDIRDSINNVGLKTIQSFTMLQKTMVTGFTMLSNGLTNIGNIAAKDLGLEQIQTNIDIENEKDEDRDNSLRDEKKTSPGMLDALKNAFDGFVDKIQNSEVLKAGLFGLLALALFTQIDKVSKIFTEVFRFIGETVIPNLKELNKIIQDSPSGYLGLGGAILAITTLFKGLRSVVTGVGVFIATISRPLAAIGRFLRGSVRILSKVISPLLKIIPGLGILGAFAKTLGPIGLAIQVIIGAFTFVNEFIKSWKAEGDLMTALGAGLIGVYDVLIGATLNLLADLGGFIVKKLGFEELGQKIADLDFNFDSVVNAIENVFDKIKDLFDIALDGLKSGLNFLLPKSLEFEMSSEKKITDVSTINEPGTPAYNKKAMDNIKKGLPADFEQNNETKTVTSKIEQEKLQSFNETYVDNIVKESSIMKEKQIEMNKLETVKNNDTPPGNITVVTDAKKITGDTVVSNNTTVSNHRVDSIESSSNALLQYFRT